MRLRRDLPPSLHPSPHEGKKAVHIDQMLYKVKVFNKDSTLFSIRIFSTNRAQRIIRTNVERIDAMVIDDVRATWAHAQGQRAGSTHDEIECVSCLLSQTGRYWRIAC